MDLSNLSLSQLYQLLNDVQAQINLRLQSINLENKNNNNHEHNNNEEFENNDNHEHNNNEILNTLLDKILYIKKPINKSVADIYMIFEQYGPIENYRYDENTNDVILEYYDWRDARDAYRNYKWKHNIHYGQSKG